MNVCTNFHSFSRMCKFSSHNIIDITVPHYNNAGLPLGFCSDASLHYLV